MSFFERVVARMSDPAFYSPQPAIVEVRETHVSVAFLAGDRAYKVKKPVRMPFLDYSTVAQRRRFCEDEVRLNRRFAPDVYLGVVAIAERNGELALADADDPRGIEWAIAMRRYDEDATLERLVERGAADERLAAQVGARIGELHSAAPAVGPGYWTPEYVRARLDENFDTIRPEIGTLLERLTFDAVQRFSRAFLDAHRPLLERRSAAGMVRDVHGDLRAEHVVVEPGGPLVVDCVEFDERLRCIDTAADLAYLTMDLERLGAPQLADALERAYVGRTGDSEVSALLPFYAGYRAWVRAKVTALRIRQLDADFPGRRDLEQHARALFALSLRLAWRARLPLVIVLCGVAGSGKSTLAAELSRRSGLPRLSSDHVRKELAGVRRDTQGGAELYTPAATTRTYRELAARAAAAIEAHGGVVVDATFHRSAQRALLRGTGARVLWVECTAPEDDLRRRGAIRERGPEDGSDATWPVIAAQLAAWEPLDEAPPGDRHLLHTDVPVESSLDELDAFVSAAVDRR